MSTAFLFYFHITMTGVAIAVASWHFAGFIGAPAPEIYPVVGKRGGIGAALVLWLLSGPVALMRFGVFVFGGRKPLSGFSLLTFPMALIWAFCLGVVVLETVFQLFFA